MLTVLIRTHGRPKQYGECIKSIPDSCTIFTHCDSKEDKGYVASHSWLIHSTVNHQPFFYNLHCNTLLKAAPDKGHYIFLDDDDTMTNVPEGLKDGVSYIVPFMRGNFEKPDLARRRQKIIQSGYIGLPCLILWHEHKKYVQFEATEDADYRVIKHLSTCVNIEWLDTPVVRSEKRNYGKTENVLQ